MFRDYHAVSIRRAGRCCEEVMEMESRRFLSDDTRRDTDVGLPDRGFFGGNRRFLWGRRGNDTA